MQEFAYVAAEDLDAWVALRTQLYLESGLIGHNDLDPSGRYRDRYEAHAAPYFIETIAGLRVGTFRLIHGREGTLQIAEQFGLRDDPHGYEISGFALGRAYHATGASVGAYRACFQLGRLDGYRTAYMEVEEWLLKSLRNIGLPLQLLAEPQWTFNATNYAVAIPLEDVVGSLREADVRRGERTRYAEVFELGPYSRYDARSACVPAASEEEALLA